MIEKVRIRHWGVSNCTYGQLLEEMESWKSRREVWKRGGNSDSQFGLHALPKKVYFCEAMGIARSSFDKKRGLKLIEAYRNADVVAADGTVVKKLMGIAVKRRGGDAAPCQRLTGPNLFQKAMEYGVSRGWRHFFYGASQQTLDNLKAKLEVRYPGIKIVGTYAPEFAEDPALPFGKMECDFFWVGLGCPKQEIWCEKHAEEVDAAAVLAVGAVLDFFGGASPKIPRLIDKLDLCWLWRIFTGGRKTLRRDFYCVPRAALVLIHEFICMWISNHRKRG